MSKGIKGITVEIGGDTTKLGTALAGINSKTKDLQSELKGVNTLLKMDPGNVTLLAQKQEILTRAISETKEKLETLKNVQEQVQRQFENGEIGEDQYRSFQREIVATEQKLEKFTKELDDMVNEADDAGKKLDDMGDDAKQAGKKIDQVGDEAKKAGKELDDAGDKGAEFGEKLKTAGSVAVRGITAVATAVGATVTALAGASVSAAGYADDILTLSSVTGISTDKLQEFSYASELVDVSLETLTKSMAKNIKSMYSAQEGSKNYTNAYKQLGIEITDTNGQLRDGEEVYWEAIDALGEMTNETERDAIAMQLFGRSAQELNPLIEAGSEKLKDLANEAHEVGAVLSGEALEALGAFDDSIQRLKGSAGAAKNALGTVLLPELQSLTDIGTSLLNEFTTNLNESGGGLDGFISTIDSMSGDIGDQLGSVVSNILLKIGDLAPALGDILITALTTISDMLPQLIESGVSLIGNLIIGINRALPQLVSTLGSAVSTAIVSIAQALPDIAQSISEAIPEINNALISALPDILSAVILLVENLVASVDQILPPLLESIPVVTQALCDALVEYGPDLLQGVLDLIITLVGYTDEIIAAILPTIPMIITAICQSLADNIPILIEAILTLIVMIATEILPKVLLEIAKMIPSILSSIISGLATIAMSLLSNLGNWISTIITTAKDGTRRFIESVINYLKELPSKIWTWLSNTANKVVEWGSSLATKGREAATKLFNSIVNKIKEIPSKVQSIGGELVTGIWNGINNKFGWLTSKIREFTNGVTNALKTFFKIKSPSRLMRDEIGVQIVAGIIAGIDKEKDNAKKSAQELGELYFKELESTIKKKQDYKEITFGDEIFLWSQLLEKYEKGSDNYKEAELKVFDAHKRFIEDMRKTNDMSVQDEMAYWANLSTTCEDGSVLYKYIIEQYGEAVKEYEDSLVKNHEDYVKQLKDDNRMSLSDEIQYWKKLLKQTEKGSDNYCKIYNNMVAAEKELTEESTKLQTDYLDDVQKIKDDLIKNIQSVTDAYDKAVSSRRDTIVSSMGLFDAFKADKDIDKYTLTMNLESQVEALKDWDNVLSKLSNRKGLKNSNLLSDLQNMGVDSIGTLKQINAMSDEELRNYINLYNEKSQIATNRAIAENEALKAESERQIQQLTADANRQLNELETVYNQNLASLGVTTVDRSYSIGRNIVQGLMGGISSETPNFQSYLTSFFSSIISNAKNALQIYSPSRVFANEVGKQIPAGIAKGISDNSGIANKAIRGMTDDLVNESSLLNGATITRKLNTTFSATLGNGRTLSDVMNTMIDCSNKIYDRLNRLQIVLDSGTLVGETIDKIDAGLADRQILTARGL